MTATGARSAAPPDELVARFKAALERLWPRGGKLGLAVSGGPDSMAMLLLAEAAIPGRFEVATVDHGLRPESVAECKTVADICAERGIPCEVLTVRVSGGNLQAEARAARYEALLDWAARQGLDAVATAHHVDDQAETLLMRLNRGSGVSGLAGVREWQPMGNWIPEPIRPLLGFRKADLKSVVRRAGLRPVEDPSNVDGRFDRARVRKKLARVDWLDPVALARSAQNLADADEAIEWMVRDEWTYRTDQEDGVIRYRGDWRETNDRRFVPREVALRLVERAVAAFGGKVRRSEAARLADSLGRGEGGSLGGVIATVEGKEWVFRREPPRRAG
jgi:tRNA(Ile)-lysidine synthase